MTHRSKWQQAHEVDMMAGNTPLHSEKMATGVMLSWGANSYGQLGNGNIEDVASPVAVSALPFTPITITGGGGHSLFVTDKGQLYACGWNNKGQLSLPEVTANMSLPHQVHFFSDKGIRSVAAGWDHSILCTDDGKLYTWGSNAFGQLGCPSVKGCTNIPTRVDLPKPVSVVAAGLRHSLVLTECGTLYAWGSGKKGQLGVCQDGRPPTTLCQPHQVCLPKEGSPVKQIVCGAYHSAALTESGEVYIWGENKHGQMALPSAHTKSVLSPCQVSALPGPVSHIHSGWTHMLAVLDTGVVLSWGRNDYGQLGRPCHGGDSEMADPLPSPVLGLLHPTHLTGGSEHNLALMGDGSTLSWGWNEHGICGTGGEVNVPAPHLVAALQHVRVEVIGCSNGHSCVYGQLR